MSRPSDCGLKRIRSKKWTTDCLIWLQRRYPATLRFITSGLSLTTVAHVATTRVHQNPLNLYIMCTVTAVMSMPVCLLLPGKDPLLDKLDGKDINSVAGVLKLYFRELKDPLFPFHMFSDLMACSSNCNFNSKLSSPRVPCGLVVSQASKRNEKWNGCRGWGHGERVAQICNGDLGLSPRGTQRQSPWWGWGDEDPWKSFSSQTPKGEANLPNSGYFANVKNRYIW